MPKNGHYFFEVAFFRSRPYFPVDELITTHRKGHGDKKIMDHPIYVTVIHILAAIGLYEVLAMLRNSNKETKQTIGLIAIICTAITGILLLTKD